MKSKFVYLRIFVILIVVISLYSCEDNIECGSLIINNLPSIEPDSWSGKNKYWDGGVYFDIPEDGPRVNEWISTAYEYNKVAKFETPNGSLSDKSPFTLMEVHIKDTGFLTSGEFLVVITPFNNWGLKRLYYMPNVVFKNGNATIDFNDMNRIYW